MHPLYIDYGEDAHAMTRRLLDAADARRLARAGMRIVIKPNAVVAQPSAQGATTSPRILAGLIEWLLDAGCDGRDLCIAEGAWVGEDTWRAFRACGYEDVARTYGVDLVDLKADAIERVTVDGVSLDVCATALHADLLIDVPVLKAHCQTLLTCALKNLKGCIPDREKRRYHQLGLTRPIARLAAALRPGLTLVDGLCGDLTFEEGGHPVAADRMMLCEDPVLVDAYAAELIGLRREDVAYIALAAQLGVGSDRVEDARIVCLNPPVRAAAHADGGALVRRLTRGVEQRDACSACLGALVHALHRLDEAGRPVRDVELCIGQGFRGVRARGFGVGRCCAGCAESVPGCPPTAAAIYDALDRRSRGQRS